MFYFFGCAGFVERRGVAWSGVECRGVVWSIVVRPGVEPCVERRGAAWSGVERSGAMRGDGVEPKKPQF
jgi:hypothetical protein